VRRRPDTGQQLAGKDLAPTGQRLAAAAGSVLGRLFGTAAVVRRGKPLHPHGVVLDAVVVNRASGPVRWGAAWLDEPGEDHGIARLSRAAGLPGQLPDIMGLALAITGPAGTRHDLLLASTGLGRLSRFMLTPRRDPASASYSSLLPYTAASGPVLLAVAPVRASGREVPAIPRHRSSTPLEFRMLAAAPSGCWHEYGLLRVAAREGAEPDPPVTFDPILNPLPGLRFSTLLTQLREPAYAAARRRTARDQPRSQALPSSSASSPD
jgi:hypothetical protein